jgi:hypothetical protein
METVLSVIAEFRGLRGHFTSLLVDRASYFNSDEFVKHIRNHFEADVTFLCHRAPFMGGSFERLHKEALLQYSASFAV